MDCASHQHKRLAIPIMEQPKNCTRNCIEFRTLYSEPVYQVTSVFVYHILCTSWNFSFELSWHTK